MTAAIALWGSAAAFVVAASLLWRARARWLVVLSVVGVIGACVGSAWGIAHARSHASPRAAAFNALPLGVSQAAAVARLGEPVAASAHASRLHGGPALPCLLWPVGDRGRRRGSPGPPPPDRIDAADHGYALLCFARGRLAVRIGELSVSISIAPRAVDAAAEERRGTWWLVGGVAAELGDRLEASVTFIRVLLFIGMLLIPHALVLYAIAAFVVPHTDRRTPGWSNVIAVSRVGLFYLSGVAATRG